MFPHVSQISEVRADCEMKCEMETRFKQIQTRLKAVTQESEEVRGFTPQYVSVADLSVFTYLLNKTNN